jgi:beta-N-acetylhexosaminidase
MITQMIKADLVRDFGQLFLLAFDGARLSAEVAEFFRTFRIGGVILFGDNYRDPRQLRALTAEVQERCAPPGAPLFISSDHEGGRVQRFRDGFTRLEPMAVYGRGEPAATEEIQRRAAAELAAAGVNLNLAPVADLCPVERPGAIGDRAFGEEPERVAAHVAAAVRGIQAAGLLACAKHFPGHGPTDEDSHRVLPVIRRSRAELESRDLVPFRAALAAGVDAVMTAHVVYPEAGDADWPASLSPHWHGVLREEMGFAGLIVTDAIEMKGLTGRWSPLECGARALAAGADVLLYYKEAHQFSAVYELRRALERGEIDPRGVAASLERVRRIKRRIKRRLLPVVPAPEYS